MRTLCRTARLRLFISQSSTPRPVCGRSRGGHVASVSRVSVGPRSRSARSSHGLGMRFPPQTLIPMIHATFVSPSDMKSTVSAAAAIEACAKPPKPQRTTDTRRSCRLALRHLRERREQFRCSKMTNSSNPIIARPTGYCMPVARSRRLVCVWACDLNLEPGGAVVLAPPWRPRRLPAPYND